MKMNYKVDLSKNNMVPVISILCQIKNGVKYLPYLLHMYQYQNYPEEQSELIIIDNSTDSNQSIIDFFPNSTKKSIKYYHASGSYIRTKDLAINNINGDYVLLLEEYDYISSLLMQEIGRIITSKRCKSIAMRQSVIWYTLINDIFLQKNDSNPMLLACHRSVLLKTRDITRATTDKVTNQYILEQPLPPNNFLLQVFSPKESAVNYSQLERSHLSIFTLQDIITDSYLLNFYQKFSQNGYVKIKWDAIDNIVIMDDGSTDADRIRAALVDINVPDKKITYYSLPITNDDTISKTLAHIGIAEMASANRWANYLVVENGVYFTLYEDCYKKLNILFTALQHIDWEVIVLGAAILDHTEISSIDSLSKVNKLKSNCCYIANQSSYKKIRKHYQSQLITLKLVAYALNIPSDGEIEQRIPDGGNWLAFLPNFAYQYQRYNSYAKKYQDSLSLFFSDNQPGQTSFIAPVTRLEDCVGFYMATSLQYKIYERIIYKLQQRGIRCCLVLIEIFDTGFTDEMLEFVQTLEVKNLAIKTLSSIHQSGQKFSVMVAPYYCPSLKGISQRYIRAMYGVGKEEWDHAWWNVMFDKILCYGNYHKDRLNIVDNCNVVGNPSFDLWYRPEKRIDINSLINLDDKRKTILYAPTYGVLSSINSWARCIGKLQKKYNVIAKLHHRIAFADDCVDQLKVAKSNFKNIITRTDINLELLECCDYVLTDNSGFIFDAIQAQKKVIILTSKEIDMAIKRGEGHSNIKSAEFTIRAYLPVADNPEKLLYALSDEYDWLKNEKIIEDVRKEYCDPWQDGNASERAADCIAKLLYNKESEISNDIGTNLRKLMHERLT